MRPSFFFPRPRLALLTLALGALLPAPAADAIISSNGTNGTGKAVDASTAGNTTYMAVGFTIAAGSTYNFSDAIAYGITMSGPPVQLPKYSIGSLWMGNSGQPATFVQNLTTSSVSGTTYEFTPTSAVTLTGGDTYWLVLTSTKKTFNWAAAASTPTGPGATYVSAGQGALSGSASSPSVASYPANGGTPAGFEIDGTPHLSSAPEPGSLALLGSVAGVVTLGGWWKRRRRAASGEPGA